MGNIPDDPSAIMETAIANEVEGHRILQDAGAAATDPLAKATFDFLASEELGHIQLIKDFAQSLAGVGELDEDRLRETTLGEAGAKIRSIFERFAVEFQSTSAGDNERLDVYKVAMDMEQRGHDFYSSAAEKVTDQSAKKLLNFLASEEIRHFRMIQDTHDFLEHPDGILAMEERWMQT